MDNDPAADLAPVEDQTPFDPDLSGLVDRLTIAGDALAEATVALGRAADAVEAAQEAVQTLAFDR